MNCIEFNSGVLGSFIIMNTGLPASYKAAGHRSRHFCRLQRGHKAVTVTDVNPHIARWINI